jgi:hypothetical protein
MSIEDSVAGAPPRKRQKMSLDPSEENTAHALLSLSIRKSSSKKNEEGTLQWPRRKSSSKRYVPNIPKRVIPKNLIPYADGILVSDDEDDSKEVACSSNKRYFQHALHGVIAHQSIAGGMPQPYFGSPLPLPPNLPSVPAGFKFTSPAVSPALIR